MVEFKVVVKLVDGRNFSYRVATQAEAQEHVSSIITSGYRRVLDNGFEHHSPYTVTSVKMTQVESSEP